MKNYKKILALSFVIAASSGLGLALHETEGQSKIWAGASYAASKAGHTAETCLTLDLFGVGEGALWGYGLYLGGAGLAGVAVGVAFGL